MPPSRHSGQAALEKSPRIEAQHRIIAPEGMVELDNSELFELETGAETRPRSFTHDEMVTCESCLRANPPTRANCLYCGEQLAKVEVPAATPAQSEPRPAVVAETSFYVLLPPGGNESLDETKFQEIAARSDLKGLKGPELLTALKAGASLPLSQVARQEQADQLIAEFAERGIRAIAIKSDDLKSGSGVKKIRGFEFSEAGVAGWLGTSSERLFEKWDELILMVVGRLHTSNVEDVVRRKRGGSKPVERRELSNDESVFDLYSRSSADGWRIAAESFDFSCLGERKGITTFENFRTLINFFRERAETLTVDDSYLAARPLLGSVWSLEESTRTGGWRRSGAGKIDMSTVTTIDNESQFTNYSRLLRCLKLRQL